MTNDPLNVAFLWHMHQPYYKDPFTGSYILPWVRLHAVKDYLDMVEILSGFPSIKQTFNLVPSLLEQIKDYSEGNVVETYLDIAGKEADSLTNEDKAFMLENFFYANWKTMIKPFPRYHELLRMRGLRFSKGEAKSTLRYFDKKDFLDLQVLFNLAWIDPLFRQTDKELSEIVDKGSGYTGNDKAVVLGKQFEIIGKILPRYKELWDAGQIELSTSAYYHPILPLLQDTDEAKKSTPDIRLPKRRFMHPEDAVWQIKNAMDYFQRVFGKKPFGMWPPEGSVSESVLKAMRNEGINWTATDEEVLGISISKPMRDKAGHIAEPNILYKAYRFSDVNIIFRDHGLSDLIGFVYSSWNPRDAAKDLIKNLIGIQKTLRESSRYIVPIILDGENAWEYYRNDGRDFLLYLYEGIEKEERLRTVTVSEYLMEHPDSEPLERLHSGSWIYANFKTWIGHEEDNLSWDYLLETRDSLSEFQSQHPSENLSKAWRAIYIAEGSDWNWWYGDEHLSETQKEFDELYRANLIKVYREIGKEPPSHLYIPILKADRAVLPKKTIRGFISPKMDGIVTSYFEWYQSASMDVGKSGGSMHKAESLLSEIHYGFNLDNLFLRLDPKLPFREFPEGSTLSIFFLKPDGFKVDVTLTDKLEAGLFEKSGEIWQKKIDIADVAIDEIFEIGIPFSSLDVKPSDEVALSISVNKEGDEIERCPWRGYISLIAPTADFEAIMWY
ncbi:MAG: hypothetical protein HY805_07380 [Nitrospirae bacterium]|nr:hypothetical protein [Nitrospirota bacterium]